MKINVLGIDLGKSALHVFGVGQQGKAVLRQRMTRRKLVGGSNPLAPTNKSISCAIRRHGYSNLFVDLFTF